jgi:hypothetical protein
MRRISLALTLLATLAIAAPAAADRKATKAERAAIKPVVFDVCDSSAGPCRFHGARISTANPRFAWANATNEGFSGALMKRPTRRSRQWRVVATQGGGIGECSYWRKHAPRAVLRDLRIKGLVGDDYDTRNCGKRG